MLIPGIDEELGLTEIAFHDVIEQTYWDVNFAEISGPDGDVDGDVEEAAVDSGTSCIMEPNTLFQPLLEGITVEQLSSNLDSLSIATEIFFTHYYLNIAILQFVINSPLAIIPYLSVRHYTLIKYS